MKLSNKSILLFSIFVLLFFCHQIIKADVLENEYYKVIGDTKTGLFNVFLKKYNVYAFFQSNPLSSKIIVKYDSFVYTMDTIGDVKKNFVLENDNLVYIWETKFLSISQKISIVKLDELNYGIDVKMSVTNLDPKGHFIGIALLFDTYFGEKYFKPYRVSNIGLIESEQYYTKSKLPVNVFSLDNPDDPVTGVVFYTRRGGYTTPDELILANYDLLKQEIWDFTYTKNNSFDSNFKKGDAAVGLLFKENFLNSNQTRDISYLIGFYPFVSEKTTITQEEYQNESADLTKKSEEMIKYMEEQIEKLTKRINELKSQYENLRSKANQIDLYDQLIASLIQILQELDTLMMNIDKYTEEELGHKIKDIENRLAILLADTDLK